jgi:hypothetical protein
MGTGTMIPVRIETREKLRKIGSKVDTYDSLINRLLEKTKFTDIEK